MLYKVTPMLSPEPEKKAKVPRDPSAPKEPRKRRKSAVYDADGNEVLITMMCLKCRSMKPLTMFGLRKMADGAIRNQPWCRGCRSGAGTQKKKEVPAEVEASVSSAHEVARAEVAQSAGAPSVAAEAPPPENAPA
jgi:hypothetical protein